MARWVQFIGGRMRWVELGEPLGPEPEPARNLPELGKSAVEASLATPARQARARARWHAQRAAARRAAEDAAAVHRAARERRAGEKWRARLEPRLAEFPALAAMWEVPPCRDTPCTCGRWIVLLARERAERRRLDQLADRVPIAPPVIAPRLGRAASDVEV